MRARREEVRGLLALLMGLGLALAGCSPNDVDDSDNLFPAQVLDASSNGGGNGSGNGASFDVPVLDPDTAEVAVGFAGSYRIDCIKIEQLGSVGADAFQTQFLGVAWTADITDWKLNILVDLLSLDVDTGDANFRILSGVGTSPTQVCAEPTTISPETVGAFDEGKALIRPESDPDLLDDGHCVSDLTADATDAEGTADFALGVEDIVWIYAEDNDGTPFNCNAAPEIPNAVPLHAVTASFVVGEDGSWAAGRLNGCLTLSEAEVLCSCIGACIGPPAEGVCAGCPDGSQPLADQLAGVTTSDGCTATMGEPAFDLIASFSASKLPAIPPPCGE